MPSRLSAFFFSLAPSIKLAILFALSLIIFFVGNIWILGGFCAASVLLYGAAGFTLRNIARILLPFAVLALLLSLFQFFIADGAIAALAGLRLFALLSFAAFVNATTASAALLETLERALRLFAPLGLNPRKTALALALTLRFMPLIWQNWQDMRAAQKARGGAENLPLRAMAALSGAALLRFVTMNEDIAQAIEARGFGDEV